MLARDAKAHTAQAVLVKMHSVIGPCQRPEKDGAVADSPRHWTSSVLAVCNRNDSVTADEAHRRFYADQRIRRGRTDNRAVCLRTDGSGAQIGSHRRAC